MECAYMNLKFGYRYYLIKVCVLDPEFIYLGFALKIRGFLLKVFLDVSMTVLD